MNDPFADPPSSGTDIGETVSNFFSKWLSGNQHQQHQSSTTDVGTTTEAQSDVAAAANGTGAAGEAFPRIAATQHRRTDSQVSKSSDVHGRTQSMELDDHMDGSAHRGTDICLSCGVERMRSVYCTVTQLHHGTDLPAETPNKQKKRQSLFSRLRDSMSGLTPPPSSADSDDARKVASPLVPPAYSDERALPPHGTIEEGPGGSPLCLHSSSAKEIDHLEGKERRKITDNMKLAAHEIERQLHNVHNMFHELIKTFERERKVVMHEAVACGERIVTERKRELEEIKKLFQTEGKIAHKKDKERRKYLSSAAVSAVTASIEDVTSSPQAVGAEPMSRELTDELISVHHDVQIAQTIM